MIIHITNLPDDANENDLVDAFSKYGRVETVTITRDKFKGTPRGEAFIDMPVEAQAKKGMKAFNGQEFKGCPLVVKPAHKQALYGKMHVDGKEGRADHNRNEKERRLKRRS